MKAARVKMRAHSMLQGSGGWYWFCLLFVHESFCSVNKKVCTVFRNDSSTAEAQGDTCLTATVLFLCSLYRSCGVARRFFCEMSAALFGGRTILFSVFEFFFAG